MEPILENIELPSPNPQAPPNWNPANAPIPLEFYDNAPGPIDTDFALNSSFADFNLNGEDGSPDNTASFELDISDSEFQSFDDESDSCSVKSGGDQKRIAKGRNRVDKRREWGLQSPVSPTPPKRNSKHTETYQYHLISPVFKDRHHYVSKDNPKFKELEGKDPEFDECRYKYFIVCVGSHYWKRTRNQVIRPARSGARRQNAIQVRDRRMNVQTFYYSLTFELETMAPLKLRSYTDVIKAIKTQIPPQAPKLFSVSYTTFDSPVKVSLSSHQQQTTPSMRSNNLPELTSSKDFRSGKEVDPFAPGKFMDNLEELSQLDIPSSATSSGSKGGPVLVTAVQCAKVNSFGKISPIDYGESRVLQCDTDLNSLVFGASQDGFVSTTPESSRNEKSLQLTPNPSIFKANSCGSPSQVTVDVSSSKSPSTLHTTVHNTTVVGDSFRSSNNNSNVVETSIAPPPPPARTAASMNKSPDRYLSPVSFQTSESHSKISAPMDPEALNTTWTTMEDPDLTAAWNKLNEVDIIENPPLVRSEDLLLVKPHKCALTGLDGLCRCCHFSHAHAHEGHYKDLAENSGDMYGSTSSLDTLIGELWALSDPICKGSDVNETDEEEEEEEGWSCDVKVMEHRSPVTRQKKRSSSPRLPENFVSDMDEILKKQISDLERETSVSPLPKSLSLSPTSDLQRRSIERPATLELRKVTDNTSEDRSQSYDLDALGGDEGLEFAYLRHSPIDSEFDSSSVSSYHSLSPTPKREAKKKKKFVMFKDEKEAFEYFKVRHFETPHVHPEITTKDTDSLRIEPPPAPPRGSSKSRTAIRMFGNETDALDHFKIQHYERNGHDHDGHSGNQHSARTRQEYIEELNKYTPRIQPAVPVRGDSSLKFQQKLMELSRLSAACGEVADQIKHDHQEYWGALTQKYKVPDQGDKSLVSEAYQRVPFVRTIDNTPKFPVPEEQKSSAIRGSDLQKAVQTDLKNTGQISSAVSDNIMNIASSVSQAQPVVSSPSPRTVRNEIRINVTPTPEIPDTTFPRVSSPVVVGPGFWSTSSPRETSREVHSDNHHSKRSVTWCDDLTSTDDDRMSDSSASVTPDRKLEPASSSSLKSIQKIHSQKRKKKKVSWSDDYNTDDDRHSSSTSLSSSVFEPNSPDITRHLSDAPAGFSSIPSPLVNTSNGSNPVIPTPGFPRNATWPSSEMGRAQQKACPVYGQPILASAAIPGSTPSQLSQDQSGQGPSGNQVTQTAPPGPPGLAKTSLGVQRFRVDSPRGPVRKSQAPPKIPPFPLDLNET